MTALAPGSCSFVHTRSSTLGREAFAQLVSQHYRAVCAVAYSALRDRAASEEVAQEAFLLAWRKLPQLAEPPLMPSWICGIAKNLARNERRRTARTEVASDLEQVPADRRGPLDALLDAEHDAIVERALSEISETYRDPLVLYYRHDNSIRQVAAALDISEATAKQRLSRGRAQLAETVRERVEASVRRSAPGAAFTAGVLAALASLPGSARAETPKPPVRRSVGSAGSPPPLLLGAGLAAILVVGAGALVMRSTPPVEPGARAAVTSTAASLGASSAIEAGEAPPGRHFSPKRKTVGASESAPARRAARLPLPAQVAATLGRRVDLELNEVKTTEVLRLLSDVTGTPIIVRGEIGEDVSVTVRAATVQHALDVTLDEADAVWEDIDLIRVTDDPGPAGPALDGKPIDLTLSAAEFRPTIALLGDVLELPIQLEAGLAPAPVTLRAQSDPAGQVLARIVSDAGLRYELVPAIEVRPADEADEE